MSKNKVDLLTQSVQGTKERNTLTYDGQQLIEDDNDLIHKGYLNPMQAQLRELLPEDARVLTGLPLSDARLTKWQGFLSADVHSNYKSGEEAGSLVSYIVNTTDINLELPYNDEAINGGNLGELQLLINGEIKETISLVDNFDPEQESGSQLGLPWYSHNNKIVITSLQKYNISMWQKINVMLVLAEEDFVNGYNTVQLRHKDTNEGDQNSAVFEIFYDASKISPTVEQITLGIKSNDKPKWLSGVKHLGHLDSVNVSSVIDQLFSNVYPAVPLRLTDLTGASTRNLTPDLEEGSGVSPVPFVSEIWTITDYEVNLDVANRCTLDGRIKAVPYQVYGAKTGLTSISKNLLINTFTLDRIGGEENFNTENYRLPANWSGDNKTISLANLWDSTQPLGANDLQQGIVLTNQNSLFYPFRDYTTFLPENTSDYSASVGNKVWCSYFKSSSPKASIKFTFKGLVSGVDQIGQGAVNIEIKLPSQTAWLDIAKPFDGSKGVAEDGDGALVGSINSSRGDTIITATFGGKSTYDSNYRLYIRITFLTNNRVINEIKHDW